MRRKTKKNVNISIVSISIIMIVVGFVMMFSNSKISLFKMPLYIILIVVGAIGYNGFPNVSGGLSIIKNNIPYLVLGILAGYLFYIHYGWSDLQKSLMGWLVGLLGLASVALPLIKKWALKGYVKKKRR